MAATMCGDGLELYWCKDMGTCIRTLREFRKSEVIICETPTFEVHTPTNEECLRACNAGASSTSGDIEDFFVAHAFLSHCPQVQEEICEQFCSHKSVPIPLRDSAITKARIRIQQQAEEVAAWWGRNAVPESQRTADREVLSRVAVAIGVCQLNAHNLGGSSTSRGIFRIGSKLAHACLRPSTIYRFSNGEGAHIVLASSIKRGEPLTTCYLGPIYGHVSSRLRIKFLSISKLFRCRCDACTIDPDYMRGLPCPRCLMKCQDGLLALNEVRRNGVWRSHATAVRAMADARIPSQWWCNECLQVFSDGQMHASSSSREFDLEDAVLNLRVRLQEEVPGREREKLVYSLHNNINDVARHLGTSHWATISMIRMETEEQANRLLLQNVHLNSLQGESNSSEDVTRCLVENFLLVARFDKISGVNGDIALARDVALCATSKCGALLDEGLKHGFHEMLESITEQAKIEFGSLSFEAQTLSQLCATLESQMHG